MIVWKVVNRNIINTILMNKVMVYNMRMLFMPIGILMNLGQLDHLL